MATNKEARRYLPYCPVCFLFGKCDGPEIVRDPDQHLLGDWENTGETSCRKFQGEKPAGELPSLPNFLKKGIQK